MAFLLVLISKNLWSSKEYFADMGLVICSYGVGNSLRAGESLEVDIEPVEDVGGRLFLHHPWPPVDCRLRISTGLSIRCSLFNKQITLICTEGALRLLTTYDNQSYPQSLFNHLWLFLAIFDNVLLFLAVSC